MESREKKHLIKSAYEALPENGAFIAVENIIDDERRKNAFGLMMSLNMLIEFGTHSTLAARTSEAGAAKQGLNATKSSISPAHAAPRSHISKKL